MYIFLLLIFALLSSALVIPLMYFATTYQNTYTLLASILLAVFFVFISLRQLKKHGIKSAFRFLLRFLIIAAGLFLAVFLVLSGHRIYALLPLAVSSFLFYLASK